MAFARGWLLAVCVAPAALLLEGPARADGIAPWDQVQNPIRHTDAFGRVLQPLCPPEAPGHARCLSHWVVKNPNTAPSSLDGQDIAALYNMPPSAASGGAIIAAIDAFGDSTVLADVQLYRANNKLPPIVQCPGALPPPPGTDGGMVGPDGGIIPCLAVVNQAGGTSLPQPGTGNSAGWQGEISLDMDMMSAGCPDCNIVLVEANSDGFNDLATATAFAGTIPGVVAVSNSYGSQESSGDLGVDPSYQLPAGVLDLVSAGDGDWDSQGGSQSGQLQPPTVPSYPASSPHVLSVGGTMVTYAPTTARGWRESVWNISGQPGWGLGTGTGSGCSTVFPQPAYQAGLTGACTMRAENDLAAASDYFDRLGAGHIATILAGAQSSITGTSASSPLMAALLARLGVASTIANNIGWVYQNAPSFYDLTAGNNDPSGTCHDLMCNAGCGWDGPTGVGSVNGVAITGLTSAGNAACVDAGASSSSGSGSGSGSSSGGGSGSSSGTSSGGSGSGSGSGGPVDSGDEGGSSSGSSSGGNLDGSVNPDAMGDGGGDGGSNASSTAKSGCGCYVAGVADRAPMPAWLALGGIAALGIRRRRK